MYRRSVCFRNSLVVLSTNGSYCTRADMAKAELTQRRNCMWKSLSVVLNSDGRLWPLTTDCWTT